MQVSETGGQRRGASSDMAWFRTGSGSPAEVTLKLFSLLPFTLRKELGILIISVAVISRAQEKKKKEKVLHLIECC